MPKLRQKVSYVMVDFICTGLVDLRGTRNMRKLQMRNYFVDWNAQAIVEG